MDDTERVSLLIEVGEDMPVDKYEFLEWYKLNPLVRADLMSVTEGVRPGAKLELWRFQENHPLYYLPQQQVLENCLKRFVLSWVEHEGVFYVSSTRAHLDHFLHKECTEGEFLGYPACCITAFEEGCEKSLAKLDVGPAVKFWRKTKQHHNLLFGCLLHIPCDACCEPSIAMAQAVKDVLEKYDVGALLALSELNQGAFYEFHFRYPEK